LERAAEDGVAQAQYSLGVVYLNGIGLESDSMTALVWLVIAAANGDDQALELRDLVSATLPSEQQHEARQKAREWMELQKLNQMG